MNINDYLSDDALTLVFSELPIPSIKTVLCTSWRWNRIANTDPIWIMIAGKLPMPGKISKSLLKNCPEWKVYNEVNRLADKIKHFLINSRTVFLFITDEIVKHEFGRPFSYDRGFSGCNFYPEGLWPQSIIIGIHQICTFYPFQPRDDFILPICVLDQQGQPIEDKTFPNRVQYFYLLDKNEGGELYWIYNNIFYRIICSQQSIYSALRKKTFQELVSERVNSFVEKDPIISINIENKKRRVEEIHQLIDYSGIVYDKRWLLIC